MNNKNEGNFYAKFKAGLMKKIPVDSDSDSDDDYRENPYAKDGRSYVRDMSKLESGILKKVYSSGNQSASFKTPEKVSMENLKGYRKPNYDKPISVIDLKKGSPIKGVKRDAKEFYLTDAEFQSTFGMKKEGFARLPYWKKSELKRKTGYL